MYSDDVDTVKAEVFAFGLRLVKEVGLSPLLVDLDSLRVASLITGYKYRARSVHFRNSKRVITTARCPDFSYFKEL